MKTAKVDIPNYLTLNHYLSFQAIEDVENDRDLIVNTVSIMTGHPVSEIRQWGIDNLVKVYKALTEVQLDTQPEFYVVLKVEDVLYGFQPMSKMTVGEYMDLERLSTNVQQNISEIAAILYRPIKEHKLDSFKFQVKSNIQAIIGRPESVFPYYTLVDYDSNQRKIDKEKMLDFPASVLLGGISFFLLTGTALLESTQTSSQPKSKKMKLPKTMKAMEGLFRNTMDGSTRYMSLRTLPSFKSQEISRSSI